MNIKIFSFFTIVMLALLITRSVYNNQKVTTQAQNHGEGLDEIQGALIQEFPTDIPHPPFGEVESSYKKVSEGKEGFSAEWHISEGSVLSLRKFYLDELPKMGWIFQEIPEYPDDAEEVTYIGQKQGRQLYVSIEFEDDKLEVIIDQPILLD